MAAQIPKEFADRILDARLALKDGGFLYAGDAPAQMPYQGIHGVSVSLNYGTGWPRPRRSLTSSPPEAK